MKLLRRIRLPRPCLSLRGTLIFLAFFLVTTTGGALLAAAEHLAGYQSEQITHYNNAVTMKSADGAAAAEAFDLSLAAYSAELDRPFLERLIYPPPSSELAALAYAHQGEILALAGKQEEAGAALKRAIELNPIDEPLAQLSAANLHRLEWQALIVRHNLELVNRTLPEGSQRAEPDRKKDAPERRQAPVDNEGKPMKPGGSPGKNGDI